MEIMSQNDIIEAESKLSHINGLKEYTL